jgi:hypothetical protein
MYRITLQPSLKRLVLNILAASKHYQPVLFKYMPFNDINTIERRFKRVRTIIQPVFVLAIRESATID